MFGFEKANTGESAENTLEKELKSAQEQKLALIENRAFMMGSKAIDPSTLTPEAKNAMFSALNDIIANLQEQRGAKIESTNEGEPAAEEGEEDAFSNAINRSGEAKVAKRVEDWRDKQNQ